MIYCTSCGTANREGSRFCNECGSPLGAMTPCPHCGLPNVSTGRFCNFCGGRLRPTQAEGAVAESTPATLSIPLGNAPSPKPATSPVAVEESTPARKESEEAGARPRIDSPSDLRLEPASVTSDAEMVAMGDDAIDYAEKTAGDLPVLDWLKPEPPLVEAVGGLVAEQARAVSATFHWGEAASPTVEAKDGTDGGGQVEAVCLPIEALEASGSSEREPLSLEESASGIVLAQSLRRPPVRREIEGDGEEQVSAMANVFTGVINSSATIVSLEQYRRTSKRGWFKW